MKNNVNVSHWKLSQTYTAGLCAGYIKAWQKQEILCGSNESLLMRVTKSSCRNHNNSGKEDMDVIVKVYIRDIKNLWVQIHLPTTKNLQVLV